uniref:Uncharacterized protein n=1 Tax=Trichuris muris TaxID=70415 RepID=A0A5S6Q1G1_TRIMR
MVLSTAAPLFFMNEACLLFLVTTSSFCGWICVSDLPVRSSGVNFFTLLVCKGPIYAVESVGDLLCWYIIQFMICCDHVDVIYMCLNWITVDATPEPQWLEKVELVCKLRGIDDIATIIPLRLTGGAFAVYSQLADKERKSPAKVKGALLSAFAVDPYVAYELFVMRKLGVDESPDVFLAELRRLTSLFVGVSERTLACAFVAGEGVRQLLRAGSLAWRVFA